MNEIVIQFIGRRPQPQMVKIGNERENLAQRVMFVLPPDVKGNAVLHLVKGVYADVVTLDETLVFEPTLTQTQYPGNWTAYLEVLGENEMVWKSDVFRMTIAALPDDGQIEKAYPSAFEEAIAAAARLSGLEAEVETLPPGNPATVETRKREDGKEVLVFGIPTGVGAPGKDGEDGKDGNDGFSPIVEITAITGGHRLYITDVNGTRYVDIMDGADGADGFSPTITATAIDGGYQLTITDANGTQTINILNGKDGSGDGTGGGSGADGYSPTITVSEITGGHRLTLTDVNGSRYVDILDGVDGAAGADGAKGEKGDTGPAGPAGYSPVRGTDYWTAADIAEIKAYVDTAILGGEW